MTLEQLRIKLATYLTPEQIERVITDMAAWLISHDPAVSKDKDHWCVSESEGVGTCCFDFAADMLKGVEIDDPRRYPH